MKVFLTTIAALTLSFNCFGQAQSPIQWGGKANLTEAMSATNIKVVKIRVKNTSDSSQGYEIRVNGKLSSLTGDIRPSKHKIIDVPVLIEKPNVGLVYNVCSISIPKKGEAFRSRVCTVARLFWAK